MSLSNTTIPEKSLPTLLQEYYDFIVKQPIFSLDELDHSWGESDEYFVDSSPDIGRRNDLTDANLKYRLDQFKPHSLFSHHTDSYTMQSILYALSDPINLRHFADITAVLANPEDSNAGPIQKTQKSIRSSLSLMDGYQRTIYGLSILQLHADSKVEKELSSFGLTPRLEYLNMIDYQYAMYRLEICFNIEIPTGMHLYRPGFLSLKDWASTYAPDDINDLVSESIMILESRLINFLNTMAGKKSQNVLEWSQHDVNQILMKSDIELQPSTDEYISQVKQTLRAVHHRTRSQLRLPKFSKEYRECIQNLYNNGLSSSWLAL